jgi:hypothetical protein
MVPIIVLNTLMGGLPLSLCDLPKGLFENNDDLGKSLVTLRKGLSINLNNLGENFRVFWKRKTFGVVLVLNTKNIVELL